MAEIYSDDLKSDFEYEPIHYAPKKSTFKKIFKNVAKVVPVLFVSLFLLYKYNDHPVQSFVMNAMTVPEDVDMTITRFLSVLTTTNEAEDRSRELTKFPHLAGHDMADVDSSAVPYIVSKFEEYGLKVYNQSYNVSLNTPKKTSLKMFGKKYPFSNSTMYASNVTELIYEASLFEDELPEDPLPESAIYQGGWHGMSKNGTVEAPFVFVNYGTKEDFTLLNKFNVTTKDRVCIAKYGKIYRGLKVKFAQEIGECAAVVLYSDPGDDHYKVKDGDKAYPEGPARNPTSIQRGSVLFLSELQENVTDFENIIPKIPSVPCSYASIKPILEKLNGHGMTCENMNVLSTEKDWCNGAIEGLQYSTGPAPVGSGLTLQVENIQEYSEKTIYNIMGNLTIGFGMPKTERGYILIGAHRDTWSSGGADPESGTAVILEILRSLKFLQDTYAWLPKTKIVFASWDAEEYGLIGSNVYATTYAKDLKSNALAYLNVDVACSGSSLNVQSSPLLNEIIKKSLARVTYPKDTTLNLYEHFFSTNERIGSLGSGSDYTAFLEHLGIPSLDIGFGSGPEDPTYHYHSNFDSFYWMSKFQDPEFKYHNAIAQAMGSMLLELSENELVQFKTAEYLELIDGFFADIANDVPEEWYNFTPSSVKEPESLIVTKKSKKDKKGKKGKKEKKLIDLMNDVYDSILISKKLALKIDAKTDDLNMDLKNIDWLPYWEQITIKYRILSQNMKLKYFERRFLDKEGLKDRPFFKHAIYAAGHNTGYAATELPGLRDALDEVDPTEFYAWLKKLSKIF